MVTAFPSGQGGLQLLAFTSVIGNTAVGNGTGIRVACPSNLVANTALDNTEDIVTFSSGCTRSNNSPTP